MSTHVSPHHHGLPPPVRLDLMDGDRVVGWVSGNRVGFRGFANEVEAAHAAWVAYRTLSRRLARRYGTRPIPIHIEAITIQRRDGDEVVLASGRKIATLVRPGAHSLAGPDSFGFELAIPQVTDELGMRSKAHFIYRTLRKAGTRWALWERTTSSERAPRSESLTAPEAGVIVGIDGTSQETAPEHVDTANHQRGGYHDVTQRSGQRAWWLRIVPWRRAGRLARGTGRRAARV